MVMPGDTVKLDVKLVTPVALEESMHFAIREGGRTVGAGVVARGRPFGLPVGFLAIQHLLLRQAIDSL